MNSPRLWGQTPPRTLRWAEVALVAVAYVVTARISQLFAVAAGPGNVTPVWIPSGLMLAWALRRGPWIWPGVFVGAGFGNAWTYFDAGALDVALRALAAGAANGLGDTVCVVGGAWAFVRLGDRALRLSGPRAATVFIAAGCVLGPLVSALAGVGGLVGFGFVAPAAADSLFATWWIGDGAGAVLLTPLVLSWTSPARPRVGQHHLEATLVAATAVAVLSLEYLAPGFHQMGAGRLVFLMLTFWSAMRLPARYTFTGVVGVVAGSIWLTAQRGGDEGLVQLQLFMAVLGVAAVGVTALVNVVHDLNARLRARVAEGDVELALRGAAIEVASSAIAVVDPSGTLRWGNPAFQRLTGGSAQVQPEELARWRRLRPGEHSEDLVVRRRPDDTEYTAEQTVTVLDDGGGQARAFVVVQEDVTPFLRNEARLSYMAHHDALTRLLNRAGLIAAVEGALGGRQPTRLALLLLDLDRFKDINDALGHAAGDAVLQTVAARLLKVVREGDVVARLGGDEFAVLQRDVTEPADAGRLARRILGALAEPIDWRGQPVRTAASVGVALGGGAGEAPLALLERADLALYAVKGRGRGDFEFYDEAMTEAVRARLARVRGVERALDAGALTLAWQPQWRLDDGALLGLEALCRLPGLPHLPVGVAVANAEQAGLVPKLGRLVLTRALDEIAAQRAAGRTVPRVSVNVSLLELRTAGYAEQLLAELDQRGLPGGCLAVEFTESAFLGDTPQVRDAIATLHRAGVGLVLDDFGTGYSSLAMVGELPLDQLKVDRAFVARMGAAPEAAAIVRATLRMAHALGLQTIAEGVETPEQLAQLRALQCQGVQGFLLGRPTDRAGLQRLLECPVWPVHGG